MTIEEIRKGAPLGATHFRLFENAGVVYYKYVFGVQFVYAESIESWRRSFASKDEIKPL